MMTGLCAMNLGGCHEGERSEPMPALALGQGVEQNFQRLITNATNDKIGILSHEGNGHGNPSWRHEHAQKSTERSQFRVVEGGTSKGWPCRKLAQEWNGQALQLDRLDDTMIRILKGIESRAAIFFLDEQNCCQYHPRFL